MAKSKSKTTKKSKSVKASSKKSTKKDSKMSLSFNKKGIIKGLVFLVVLVLGILVIDLGVQYFYQAPAAIVNGKRISYKELDERLRLAEGERIIDELISEVLVEQEAKNQKIEVTKDEVDKEFDTYAENFGGRDALVEELSKDGLTENEFKRRMELLLQVQKLVATRIEEPTEEDIAEYYDIKYSYLDEADRPKLEDVKAELTDEIKLISVDEEAPIWISEVRESSSIKNNVAEAEGLQFFGLTKNLFTRISDYFTGLTAPKE